MPALPANPTAVRRWLLSVYVLILLIVVVGGITRLTGSGLSIVHWRPVTGWLPPLSEADWLVAFAEYKSSPQYQQVNHWMQLADFKPIFFWEYLHRLVGRLIGVAFFLPWLWFVVRGQLRGGWALKTGLAFVLGGLQGALGWYMVKSGLVDEPSVSHYRLAAHLGLAFFVACYLLWMAMDLNAQHLRPMPRDTGILSRGAVWGLVALLAVQTVWGAFMAGSRAGLLFNTFPDMNGAWIPTGWLSLNPVWRNLFSNPVAIHFIHRILAYVAVIAALAVAYAGWSRAALPRQRAACGALAITVLLQFLLGALTVIWSVPIHAATAHQGLALVLLSAALWVAHAFTPASASHYPVPRQT